MFDLNGNVIGINSQILGSQGGGNIGIGFAIPAEEAKPIIATLMKGEPIKRGYLGVQLGPEVNGDVAAALGLPKNRGQVIAGVTAGGPAAKGGLRAGDVVTEVNGQAVTPDQTLSYLVANIDPGQTARLGVIRSGKPVNVNVAVAARPTQEQLAAEINGGADGFGSDDDDDDSATTAPASGNPLGLAVQPLTPGIARAVGVESTVQGVVVAAVDPSSDAGQKLKRGDVIQSINGTPVRTVAEVAAAVTAAKAAGRNTVLLQIARQRLSNFIPVKLKS